VNADVFLVPCDGSRPPVALTHTPEFTWLVSWLVDSSGVIVEEDHDGDEYTRLFRIDLDRPGEMRPLTEDCPPYFIRGGNLSSDGAALFYGANYDFKTGQVLEPTWIYRHDLVTGERKPIACPGKPAYTGVSLNLSGTHLLYSRKDRHPAGQQFYLVDVEGREDREILNFGDEAKVSARWFPDGENILVVSESTGNGVQEHQSLGVYHWPTEDLRWLIDDPDRSIEEAWVSPDGVVVVDEIREASHSTSFVSPVDWIERSYPISPGNLLPLGRAADGAWIALYYSSTSPVELVRFTFEPDDPGTRNDSKSAQTFTSLTRVWDHTELRPDQLAQAESLHWRSVDGQEIQGWLYRASPNPKRSIIYVHGGPTYH
jgi:dipeptidyl aminopeptidase/acylaminoacyl peptidase